MDRGARWRVLILERLKDLLILLLACSAIYLVIRIQGSIGGGKTSLPTLQQGSAQEEPGVELPVRMAAVSRTEGAPSVCGSFHGGPTAEEMYHQVSNLLREALGSISSPQPATQARWRAALEGAPGLHFEYLGATPLAALAEGVSGQRGVDLEVTVKQLVLTVEDGSVTLFYLDGETGGFFACPVPVIDPARLETAASAFPGNETFYAFQGEDYDDLWPYTMLWPGPLHPAVYAPGNPLGADRDEALPSLLAALQFQSGGSYQYRSSDGVVIRSGSDTLRLTDSGLLSYHAAQGEPSRYTVPTLDENPRLSELLTACRRLTQTALGNMESAARLRFSSAWQEGDVWYLEFSYCLGGAQVQTLGSRCAAQFVVLGQEIREFSIRFRSYQTMEQGMPLLPLPQAMAALRAGGETGQALRVVYLDDGANPVTAGWTLADP